MGSGSGSLRCCRRRSRAATAIPAAGRRPIDDRAALAGIVFVLKTEITWNQLPTGLVGCSG
jgi:hypothetical protein